MKRTLTLMLLAAFALMVGARGQIVNPPQGGVGWPAWAATNAGATRTNLDLRWPGLTNTNAEGFRNSLGLGANDVPNFTGLNIGDGADINSSGFLGHEFGGNLSFEAGLLEFFMGASNRFGLTPGGLYFSNNPTAQANTRTNIGLGASWLTNSNVPTPYSGAAPTGALLTADGAGGSAFNSNISISTNGGLSFGASVADNIILRAGDTQVINAKYDNNITLSVKAIQLGPSYGDYNAWIYREDLSMFGFRRFSGTNEQSVRIYGTYSDTNNYRRLNVTARTNGVTTIKPEGVGTGQSNNYLHISGLPTNDPGISGVLWNDSGTVKVSP